MCLRTQHTHGTVESSIDQSIDQIRRSVKSARQIVEVDVQSNDVVPAPSKHASERKREREKEDKTRQEERMKRREQQREHAPEPDAGGDGSDEGHAEVGLPALTPAQHHPQPSEHTTNIERKTVERW